MSTVQQALKDLERASTEEEGFAALENLTLTELHQLCTQVDLTPGKSKSKKGLCRVLVQVVVTSRINAQVFRNLDLN